MSTTATRPTPATDDALREMARYGASGREVVLTKLDASGRDTTTTLAVEDVVLDLAAYLDRLPTSTAATEPLRLPAVHAALALALSDQSTGSSIQAWPGPHALVDALLADVYGVARVFSEWDAV